MDRQLVFEDSDGKVVRTYSWSGEPVQVVRRGDTRRLELVDSLKIFEDNRIPYDFIGDIDADKLATGEFLVGQAGRLKLVGKVEEIRTDFEKSRERRTWWYLSLGLVLVAGAGLIGAYLLRPTATPVEDQKLKQEVIKIVKKIPPRQKVVAPATVAENRPAVPDNQDVKPKSIDRLKRMGALAALGSLKNSKQQGGIDLGAAQTTAGPGLGGTEGSGGTQTSLYARGLTSAPLGAGNKVEGAGGYGTKGKGGGQAGYGKMTLVGSTGAAPIGLTQEATVAAGLDRDQIAAVINQHLGQVRFCYEQGLQGSPNISGRVAVDFTIGGNGMVKVAQVESTSLNSKIVEDCIVLRLKSWKFPLPQGGVDVRVSYPFVLRRAGQG